MSEKAFCGVDFYRDGTATIEDFMIAFNSDVAYDWFIFE